MKFTSSLRRSLTLHFVVVAVLPILLLGVFGIQYFQKRHLETIFTLIESHSLAVSKEASELLYDTNVNLSLVAKTLGSGLLENDTEIDRFLRLAVSETTSFESIYLLDDQHRITHLGLSSESGSNYEDLIDLDFSSHEIFVDQPQLSSDTWSNTFLSTMTVEPSITLGIPLDRGTLLGTVSLRRLSDEMTERLGQVGMNFQFSLLDRHGILIADSRPGFTSQRVNLRQHPEVRNALDHNIEVPQKLHEDSNILESVRLVSGTGWVAYVSLPMQEAMQGVSHLRYILMVALTFAAAMGVVLAIWLSRRMSRPVLLLRDAARQVSQGNYDPLLQRVAYEELEDLSGSFREMIAAVEEREYALNDNRARYRDLVNSIDGIVWEFDLTELCFTFVSDQVEQVLGFTAKQWLEEEGFWQKHVHEEDLGWVLDFSAKETKALRDYDSEYRMIAADGRVIWLKDVVSVITDNGRPVRLRGVMLDVTKRKQGELSLVETKDRLQLILNRMPLGCIIWDAEDKAEFWNPAAEKIFGFSRQEALGQHPHDFLVPESAQTETNHILERLGQGDTLAHSVNENLTKDGRTIVCEWHNTPLQDVDGTTTSVISMVHDITQRVFAEDALKESETRFRTVFQTNPDSVLITRMDDGKIVSVNENCIKLSGYTREELVGRSSLEIGLWANPEERDQYMGLIRKEGYLENFEMLLRNKAGRERVGLTSARTLMLNNEHCVLAVVRDITEMKEAERRMARSEARFRSLISVMGDGLIILGYNGEIVQCNQAAERILKVKADVIIGEFHDALMMEAVHEDGRPYAPEEHPAALTLSTGEPVTNQVMGLSLANGQTAWLQVNTHALGLDKTGKPVAVVITFADVTRLKHTETELRESEKHLQVLSMQFQGVLEAIPDRIMILNRDMHVVWLNWLEDKIDPDGLKSFTKMYCYDLPGVVCSPGAGLVDSLCESCPVKESFDNGRTVSRQVETGEGRTFSLRAFPVFNEQGDIANVIQIAQDISESIQHQAQSMRTGQLAALGELAAGVAHEINNPINGVINYAQLILNKALTDSREYELSQRIIRESERVATIVRELLYFAREESQEVHKTTISDALSEAFALTQNHLNKDGVLLQVQLPEDLPEIMSRSHQVQQLFLNLISNARHALTEKYPEMNDNKVLSIKAEVIEKESKHFVRIVFRDRGVGIAAELLPRVMNPFTTTKSSKDGTGLGLSISHEIVQKHGGTLSIESVHGEFTEVVVELPAAN